MWNILDVQLDMDFVLAGEKCHLLNRSMVTEYSQEEYCQFNLKDVLCQILNFDTPKWECTLGRYLLEVISNIKNSENPSTTNCSNLFMLSNTIPFMFKPVQLAFLIEEVTIYFNLISDTKDLQQPYPFNCGYEDYSDLLLSFRNGICDMFIEQNRNNLQSTMSDSMVDNLDYLFIRGLASINCERVYPKFSCYGFSQLVAECNEIYQKWSKDVTRSPIINHDKMRELLADSSLNDYHIDNPTANVLYRTNVTNVLKKISKVDFQAKVYKIDSLGNLFYLLLSQSSEINPLKKCYTCNSYYINPKYTMYCNDVCKKNDLCTKLYNKLNNRYHKNLTKYKTKLDNLNNLHFSWKNREIDNETFIHHMNELQKSK